MNQNPITNYVTNLTEEQIKKLELILDSKGWHFTEIPHAYWNAKSDKISATAYKSGKFVIQGKNTNDFVLFILEPEILKKAELGYENIINHRHDTKFTPHIGIDESGKGDFFGPLVVSAVFVDENTKKILESLEVKDSKLIKNDKKIIEIAPKIRKAVSGNFSIVTIGPEAYNRLYGNFKNLNKLLAWGHSRSLENLLDKDINCKWALSDKFGNEMLILNALFKKGKSIELRQETKAESDIAVAAASMLARAEFVTRISKLSEEVGCKLPKGASSKVLEAAVTIINSKGKSQLNKLAKVHFKTYDKAIEMSNTQ